MRPVHLRRNAGFTLMKFMIVIAALGLVGAMTMSMLCACSSSDAAKEASAATEIRNIGAALALYESEAGRLPPESSDMLSGYVHYLRGYGDNGQWDNGSGDDSDLPSAPFFDFDESRLTGSGPTGLQYLDPWDKPYRYLNNVNTGDSGRASPTTRHNELEYVVWSCGPDQEDDEGKGDDVVLWKMKK